MKKVFTSMTIILIFLGFTVTAGASVISVTGLDWWTQVTFTDNEGNPESGYAGKFLLTIDGKSTSGFCIDLDSTTYVPLVYGGSVTDLDTSKLWQKQAAWLMEKYGASTDDFVNAALQLVIWDKEYTLFEYTGSNTSIINNISQMLTYIGTMPSDYSGTGYQIAHLETSKYGKGQDLIVKSTAPVPEPATLLLIGSGLLGLAGIRRKVK